MAKCTSACNSGKSPTSLLTIQGIVTDYEKLYKSMPPTNPKTLVGDIERCKNLKNICSTGDYLSGCVCNKKRHQWSITPFFPTAPTLAASQIIKSSILSKIYKNFEELYQDVEKAIGSIKGIGRSTLYDTTLRLGATHFGIWPQDYVYVHVKLIESARHLLPKCKIIDGYKIDRSEFDKLDPAFKRLSSAQIEDLLCIYHDAILKLAATRGGGSKPSTTTSTTKSTP